MTRRIATCRIQLRNGLGFAEVRSRLPYLQRLGISHLYLSPIFRARSGSTHGYDCVDPNEIDASLGGSEGFRELCEACAARGLGILLDIVPNHQGIGWENPYWRALLQEGAAADASPMFDVDWAASAGGTPGKLLLPILGKPLQQVLDAGELLLHDGTIPSVSYFGEQLPLALGSAHGNLQDILARQHWRLAWWRCGNGMLNWRRFFDITELAGVRVEDEQVFQRTHGLLLELLRWPAIDGLRVDHVDGLADPGAYLRRLARAWEQIRDDPPWIVVEKILAPGETLPQDWPVAGTTGYETLNRLHDVFVDPAGMRALGQTWRAFGGDPTAFEQALAQAKREILERNLRAELDRLVNRLGQDPLLDYPQPAVREALVRLVIGTDCYRSYGHAHPQAFDRACERSDLSDLGPGLCEAIRRAMPADSDARLRFEQLSAPAMAKSLEDTVFYRWYPLLSRNEVGSHPGGQPPALAALHRDFARARRRSSRALVATATHDTKRGEDARMRIAVLSHPAAGWPLEVSHWRRLADAHDGPDDGRVAYFVFQAMIGAWPTKAEDDGSEAFVERLLAYFEKAFREGKRHTHWLDPDEAFERGLHDWVRACLADSAFTTRAAGYVKRIDRAARMLSLGQTVLKFTVPGIPDLLHGTEWHDLSLVDPDNRRPVDMDRLERGLDAALADAPQQWWAAGAKMRVIARLLRLRRLSPALFESGTYRPLRLPAQARCFGFERRHADEHLVVLVTHRLGPNLERPLEPIRESTGIDGADGPHWHDPIRGTYQSLAPRPALRDLLRDWPVAVLHRKGASSAGTEIAR